MNMQQVTGLSLLLFLAARPSAASAQDAVPHADLLGAAKYQRADTNFYGRGDVLRAHPGAVIVAQGAVMKTGDDYFYTAKTKAPKTIYAETLNDWIEPITPPDMPASLGVPNDAMAIREPQGDVQIALPNAPTNFTAVTPNMTFPNGSILKTGDGSSVAVLFGGVDSARLMPNSEAAMQQTVTDKTRSAEVDLTAGGVFSKVGTQVGVDGKYEVHTANGNASATGGDFVTVITNGRTDVWVASGAIALNHTDGSIGVSATSDGKGPLKVMRLPAISDPHASFAADTETLSTVMNFIPLADQKLKALRAKKDAGTALSANEEAYLARIKKVPSVIKLALVEPPAPPAVAAAAAKPAPPAPTPTAETPPPVAVVPENPIPATPETSVPTPAPVAMAPAPKPVPPTREPLNVNLHPDGTIGFRGAKMPLATFQAKLVHIGKVSPAQVFVVHSGPDVSDDKVKLVMDAFHTAGLDQVSMGTPLAAAAPAPAPKPLVEKPILAPLPAPTPTAETPVAALPAATPNPAMPAPDASAAAANPSLATPSSSTPAPAASGPLKAVVRVDGKINFQKVTLTPTEFKARINTLVQTTPDQPVLIKAGKTVPYVYFESAVNICRAAQVKNLTTAGPSPVNESPADNLPAPGLILRPSMGPIPDNTTPPPTPATPATSTP
jgi:biopolymer transport protein ExbD